MELSFPANHGFFKNLSMRILKSRHSLRSDCNAALAVPAKGTAETARCHDDSLIHIQDVPHKCASRSPSVFEVHQLPIHVIHLVYQAETGVFEVTHFD